MRQPKKTAGDRRPNQTPSDPTPGRETDHDDDDSAPVTPTDEPPPIPVLDPPSDERPRPPLTVQLELRAYQ